MLDVWDDMMALQRRMDDLFRAYLGPRARPTFPALPEGLRRPFWPVTDVFEREDDLVVRLELPGIDPEKHVKITIRDGVLVVKGERHAKEEISERNYYRMESSFGAFERDVPIPEGVKEEDIKAEYSDGVLEIVLPGAASRKETEHEAAKEVPIRTPHAA